MDDIVHNDEEVELALDEEKKKENNDNTDMMEYREIKLPKCMKEVKCHNDSIFQVI
jgi:hypothetical protein